MTDHPTRSDPTYPIEIAVDMEHSGLRGVVIGVFVVMVIVSYILLSALISAASINLAAILGALVIAAGVAYVVEQQLKARWKSGKTLRLTENSVELVLPNDNTITIPADADNVQRHRWRFEITRRTHIPKGWYVVAAALEQRDVYIAAYTFMSPEDYEAFDPENDFTRLKKSSDKGDADSMRLAGEQRRLHRAETVRWHEGVEVRQDDFKTYVAQLERLFAD
jgi:hypothetical protein